MFDPNFTIAAREAAQMDEAFNGVLETGEAIDNIIRLDSAERQLRQASERRMYFRNARAA